MKWTDHEYIKIGIHRVEVKQSDLVSSVIRELGIRRNKTVIQIAREYCIPYYIMYDLLKRAGCSAEEAKLEEFI